MFDQCYILHVATELDSERFRRALEDNGYGGKYILATSSGAAQDALRTGDRPHIIVTESTLTDGATDELLDWLRTCGGGEASIPVLMYSEDASKRAFDRAVRAGAVAYLIKHFEPEKTKDDVRRILQFCLDAEA